MEWYFSGAGGDPAGTLTADDEVKTAGRDILTGNYINEETFDPFRELFLRITGQKYSSSS